MTLIFILLISFIMYKSVRHFLFFKEIKTIYYETTISFEVYLAFLLTYSVFILGFGLIYFVLSYQGTILFDTLSHSFVFQSISDRLYKSVYFSGVTLLTIGYGDITPIGLGRLIAIIQALFGYVLPTAFVLKLVQLHRQQNDK